MYAMLQNRLLVLQRRVRSHEKYCFFCAFKEKKKLWPILHKITIKNFPRNIVLVDEFLIADYEQITSAVGN
jgi:hypothetical protein